MRAVLPNQSRGCVKTTLSKSGNDQFFDMRTFTEVSGRIRWSKNEFSHSLSPEPIAVGAGSSAVAVHVAVGGIPQARDIYVRRPASRYEKKQNKEYEKQAETENRWM